MGSDSVTHGGTVNAVRRAVEAGVARFVLASSCAVYGDAAQLPIAETTPPRPLSPYAGAKLASEDVCADAADAGQLTAVCLRFFNVYGPRQDPGSEYSGVISRFLAAAAAGEPVTIYGDGGQTRDFVYVGDVVAAILAALQRPLTGVSVLNVGTGRQTDLLQILGRRARSARAGALERRMEPRARGRHPPLARRRRPRALGARLGGRGRRSPTASPTTWEWFTGGAERAGDAGGRRRRGVASRAPHHGGRRARRRRRAGGRAVDDVHAHRRRRGDAGAGARARGGRLRDRAREPADGRGGAGVRARRARGARALPIIADIHYDWRLALAAIEAGAAGVRINPGTMAEKHVREIVQAAAEARVPAAPGEPDVPVAIRIGVNAGSLPRDLRERAETDAPGALVEAALRWAEQFDEWGFTSYKLSVKSSSVPDTIAAYRLLAQQTDAPLHVGVTEAGTVWSGTIKSAVGIGALLADGIGDTIRVSLTGDPVEEVRVAWKILAALGLRRRGPEVISCPTCGRTEVDIVGLAEEVERRLGARPGARRPRDQRGRHGLPRERPRGGAARRLRHRRRRRRGRALRPRRARRDAARGAAGRRAPRARPRLRRLTARRGARRRSASRRSASLRATRSGVSHPHSHSGPPWTDVPVRRRRERGRLGVKERVAERRDARREGTGDMERAQEDVKVLGGERDAVLVTAAGFGMIGLLVGLVAFFVTVAPGS